MSENIWLVNTVTASFSITTGQMTEMSQRKKKQFCTVVGLLRSDLRVQHSHFLTNALLPSTRPRINVKTGKVISTKKTFRAAFGHIKRCYTWYCMELINRIKIQQNLLQYQQDQEWLDNSAMLLPENDSTLNTMFPSSSHWNLSRKNKI